MSLRKKAFLLVKYAFKMSSSSNNWFHLGFTKYPASKNNLSTSEEQAGIEKSLPTSDNTCKNTEKL